MDYQRFGMGKPKNGLHKLAVVIIGTLHSLFSISCSVLLLVMVAASVYSHGPGAIRGCAPWAEWLLGESICQSAASFRLTLIALLIMSLVEAICSVLLLRGVYKKCRDDMLPWLISNGAIIPVTMGLLIQQTANDYIMGVGHRSVAHYWLYYAIYWAVNVTCLTLGARLYCSMGPSRKEKQYQKNIQYINPDFTSPAPQITM